MTLECGSCSQYYSHVSCIVHNGNSILATADRSIFENELPNCKKWVPVNSVLEKPRVKCKNSTAVYNSQYKSAAVRLTIFSNPK